MTYANNKSSEQPAQSDQIVSFDTSFMVHKVILYFRRKKARNFIFASLLKSVHTLKEFASLRANSFRQDMTPIWRTMSFRKANKQSEHRSANSVNQADSRNWPSDGPTGKQAVPKGASFLKIAVL